MNTNEEQYLLSDRQATNSLSWEQIAFAVVIILPSFPAGMSMSFSAIALPQLHLNLIQTSWFASTPPLGGLITSLFSGYFIDKWGRKFIFIFSSIALCIGCILLSGPPIVMNLLLGQVLCGVAISCATVVPIIYVTESIVPGNLDSRSSLASWNVLAVSFGTVTSFVAAAFFDDYRSVTILCAVLSIILIVIFLIFIPESPAWLQLNGRHAEAKLARNRLSFQKNVSPYGSHSLLDDCPQRESWLTFIVKMRRKDVYKPFLTCIGLFFFQQFSGVQVYVAYMVDVIKPTYLSTDPYNITAASSGVVLISFFLYFFIVRKIGLRKLFMLSTAMTALSTFTVGLTLYLNQTFSWYSYYVDYVHISAVVITEFAAGLGMGTIPFTIMGELLPKDAKGYASWALVSMTTFYFLGLMLFPFEMQYIGYNTHFVFAVFGVLGVLFIYFFVPETVGRTLKEISDNFS